MAFVVTENELNGLQGQSHMNYVIYLYLRQFMDYASGVVGLKRGISYQSIAEHLYIEPRRGVKGGSPHKSTIRRAIDQLIISGLIKRIGSEDHLIFKLPIAYADNNDRKKADTNPTPHADTPNNSTGKALQHIPDTPKNAKADTPLLSDITNKPPPPNNKLVSSDQENAAGAVVVEFSKHLKPETQSAILSMLQFITDAETKQTVIDDLIGYIAQQAAKGNPVNNPVGVMRRISERVKAGEYVPELAHFGRQMRANERRANERMIESEKPLKPSSEKALADFKAIKLKLTKGKTCKAALKPKKPS